MLTSIFLQLRGNFTHLEQVLETAVNTPIERFIREQFERVVDLCLQLNTLGDTSNLSTCDSQYRV